MKSKYCMSSVASFDKINKAVTNRSSNKQTFSFSKGDRFQSAKPYCPLNTYGGNFYSKKPAGTGIGYGTRSDFTKCLTASPSSSKYRLKSFFEENASKKKGAVMGANRDKVSFNSYIPKLQQAVPSPSHYVNNLRPTRATSPKYSLRSRPIVIDKTMTIDAQNRNPGPGSYINPEIEQTGSFRQISKFEKLSYGQAKTERFTSSETMTPGPGKYKEINNMHKTGHYVLSQNRGGTKARFDRNKRESVVDEVFKKELKCPGPGYYQLPSEFGQYDGDIYNEFRNTKRSQNGWRMQPDRVSRR